MFIWIQDCEELSEWVQEKNITAQDETYRSAKTVHSKWTRHQAFEAEIASNKDRLFHIQQVHCLCVLWILLSQCQLAFMWGLCSSRVFKWHWFVCQCFGITCGSHRQGFSIQRRIVAISAWTAWPLKMGLIEFAETSVNGYEPTLLKIPNEQISQPWCCRSLKFPFANSEILVMIIYFIGP